MKILYERYVRMASNNGDGVERRVITSNNEQ